MSKGLILVKDLNLITTKKQSIPVFGLKNLSTQWHNNSNRVYFEANKSIRDILDTNVTINPQKIVTDLNLYDSTRLQNSIHLFIDEEKYNVLEKTTLFFKNNFPYKKIYLHIIGTYNRVDANTLIKPKLTPKIIEALNQQLGTYSDGNSNNIKINKDYHLLPGDYLVILSDNISEDTIEYLKQQKQHKFFVSQLESNSKFKNWMILDQNNELKNIVACDYWVNSLKELVREIKISKQSFILSLDKGNISNTDDELINNHIFTSKNNIRLIGYGNQNKKWPVIDTDRNSNYHHLESLQKMKSLSVKDLINNFV